MSSKMHLILINGKRGNGVEGRGGGRGLSPWSGDSGDQPPQKTILGPAFDSVLSESSILSLIESR
jgi:hypothetical protein